MRGLGLTPLTRRMKRFRVSVLIRGNAHTPLQCTENRWCVPTTSNSIFASGEPSVTEANLTLNCTDPWAGTTHLDLSTSDFASTTTGATSSSTLPFFPFSAGTAASAAATAAATAAAAISALCSSVGCSSTCTIENSLIVR
eukprot:CAMPEP_0173364046 /NCGR_PEP_ID=MMETSP1144-20121109/22744_1 /TAXON_ID=483371 /ORGANISM="non described non described, Strain CCMP2298" /LENGTH=140 /DNA_ID=CAMNT_0014314105 /DNA_START=88 /DNA_END=507 /DNA_ORIENTATION=+